MTAPETGPYQPCHTSSDEPLYSVKGPSDGIGYHAWYLNPQNTFETWEEAEKAARMMNIAYATGLRERSRQLRELIG